MAILLLAVAAMVFAVLSRGWDRPSRYDRNVWSPDPDECERNLKLATAAWKASRPFVAPSVLARRDAEHEAARRLRWAADEVGRAARALTRRQREPYQR